MTDGPFLVHVDTNGHTGEWLRMVACPIGDCDAVRGEDYHSYANHLSEKHGPGDVGLSSDGRRIATDGGEEVHREPPYWQDALRSFLRTLATFLVASALALLGMLAYYGVVA